MSATLRAPDIATCSFTPGAREHNGEVVNLATKLTKLKRVHDLRRAKDRAHSALLRYIADEVRLERRLAKERRLVNLAAKVKHAHEARLATDGARAVRS